MTTNLLLRATTAAALSLLLACGGSPGAEDGGGAGAASEQPSATASAASDEVAGSEAPGEDPSEESTDTAAEIPSDVPVDPEAAALAEAAALTLADLGSTYERFNKADGITPYTKDTCDPDIMSTVRAQYGGVMVKHSKEDAWLYSSSYVFPSRAEADEYVEARNGKAWLRCRTAELAQYQKENAGKRYAVELGNEGTTKGTRNAAYAQFVITFKGEPSGAHILRHVFQQGRVVLNVGVEQSGNGANNDLSDVVHDDLARAVDEALKRVKKRS